MYHYINILTVKDIFEILSILVLLHYLVYLEDFFLDASTKTKGRKIAASSDIESIKDEVRKKLTEEIREVLWDYEDALGIKVSSEIPEYRLDWCLESFGPEEERKFDKLLDAIVSYEIDGLFYYADEE